MSTAQRAPHSGAVMLDESLLHEVRRVLSASGVTGCEAFVLVELNDAGLRTSVVDATTGASLIERGDGKLCPRMLDLAMADHLVRAGRVERPSSFDWATELIDLMPDIRSRLALTDGAFAMGRDHVAMFRVSRRDYYAGLQPHLLAAQSLWQAVALNAVPSVGALVFMPEHEQWPGLYPTLSHLATIPAVALSEPDAEPDDASARHVVADDTDARPDTSVEALHRSVLPELAAAPDTPVLDAGSDLSGLDPATPVFDRAVFDTAVYGRRLVTPAMPAPSADAPADTPAPVAATPVAAAPVAAAQIPGSSTVTPTVTQGAAGAPPIEVIPAPSTRRGHAAEQHDVPLPPPGTAPLGARFPTGTFLPDPPPQALFRATGEQDVYMPVEFGERTPISVHDHRDVKRSSGPRHYTPPAHQTRASTDDNRLHRRRVLIGVTAVAAAAVAGGLIVALPSVGDDVASTASSSPQGVARTSSVPPSQTTPVRPPLDTSGAQAPVLRYTPPPPVTANQQQAQPNAPKRRAPAPPRRRSIPNPIPGLPPILLP